MSTNDDAPAAPATGIADPGPLGIAAFALTTFLLSAVNAGWAKNTTGNDWWAYAIAYGGLVQLLAGMWEFRNRNVFGATAFGSYGGFWIGLALWLHFTAGAVAKPDVLQINRDLAWILLGFAIFNTYMLIASSQATVAIFLVFLALEVTLVALVIGNFATKTAVLPPATDSIIRIGGYAGVVTAALAWYTSAAGVLNGMKGRLVIPVGGPLFRL